MIELVVNLGKLASSIFTKPGMIVFNKICTVKCTVGQLYFTKPRVIVFNKICTVKCTVTACNGGKWCML